MTSADRLCFISSVEKGSASSATYEHELETLLTEHFGARLTFISLRAAWPVRYHWRPRELCHMASVLSMESIPNHPLMTLAELCSIFSVEEGSANSATYDYGLGTLSTEHFGERLTFISP